MVFRKIYPFIMALISISSGLAEEYSFPVTSNRSFIFKPDHWQHPSGNSAMQINGIEIDVFHWMVASENRESVLVDLVNPIWEYAGLATYDMVLPEIIKINNAINFRGSPTIYIKVTPWRMVGNEVEVLTSGEIFISVKTINPRVGFSHPYLLNGHESSPSSGYSENTQYLIICPSHFNSAAQWLANIHSDSIDIAYRLNTKVVFTETIDSLSTEPNLNDAIREYLMAQIDSSLEFILFFGDENYIPPLLYDNDFPSDDLYTLPDGDGGFPLITGRIPANTEENANIVVTKISDYILRPTPGIWRSKVALVADDMYRSCSFKEIDSSHTINSQKLYKSLNELVPVLPYYGIHYGLQPTSSGCAYPDLTRDLIHTINNGVALINYIGHGDPDTWAGEKLINKTRDLSLIHPSENRLAIWVAGTCSFGNYYGENSFMEELILNKDGAIAIIASTEAVGYVENEDFLIALFNEISNFIDDPENTIQTRIGKLVWNAKNGDKKFHTFGDPALPLPFPKIGENVVDEYSENVNLVVEENISFNGSSKHSSILIRGNAKDHVFKYGTDSLSYTVPGATYVQMEISGSSACFRIPLDAGSCDSCVVIQAYQDNIGKDGRIETIPNISLVGSAEDFEDFQGPAILLFQESSTVREGSAIFPNMNLTLFLEDESGINLMETIGHGIRYAFDNDYLTLIPGNEFIYTNCSAGSVIIPVPLSLDEGKHEFYVEAWDGLNNKSDTLIYLEILPPINEDQIHLSKVYPVPSPFSNNTHFTMIATHTPVDIDINIYSINGLKVKTLNKFIDGCVESYSEDEGCFIQLDWNGKDKHGYKIANGAYFYHVKAETVNNGVFENIYKLAKVE